jgi:hypothetical protein
MTSGCCIAAIRVLRLRVCKVMEPDPAQLGLGDPLGEHSGDGPGVQRPFIGLRGNAVADSPDGETQQGPTNSRPRSLGLRHFIIDVFFDDGFIAYTPLNSGIHWSDAWREAVQFVIWLALAGGWALVAVGALRAQQTMSSENHEQ